MLKATIETTDHKEGKIKLPCLRVDEEGNMYYFSQHCNNSPMIATYDGSDPGNMYTSGSAEEYKPFKGSLTLTQD